MSRLRYSAKIELKSRSWQKVPAAFIDIQNGSLNGSSCLWKLSGEPRDLFAGSVRLSRSVAEHSLQREVSVINKPTTLGRLWAAPGISRQIKRPARLQTREIVAILKETL